MLQSYGRWEFGKKESLGSPGHHRVTDRNKNKRNGKVIPRSSHVLAVGRTLEFGFYLE